MSGIADVIWYMIQVITFAIFFRVILSWFMINPTSPFLISAYQVLVQVTDPILAPLRRIIPRIGMFDFTPLVAIILLQLIGQLLVEALS